MKQEIWKKLENFDRYEISNLGRVKRVASEFVRNRRPCKPHIVKVEQKILTPNVDNVGRIHYRLFDNNNNIKLFKITRLMWETFNGPIPDDLEVDHIDGNRFNNNLENLQLLSKEDNLEKRLEDPQYCWYCEETDQKILSFKAWCKRNRQKYSSYYLWKSIYRHEEYMGTGLHFSRVEKDDIFE